MLAFIAAIPFSDAEAHTGERAYILLLPTELYMTGGTLVVALSFVVMALVPRGGLQLVERAHWRLGRLPHWNGEVSSLAALLLAVGLVVAGYVGSRDPLENPLPLTVWTLWWVGLTFLHAVFGNLWVHLSPWRGVYRLLSAPPLLGRWRERPPLAYPAWLGLWPAVILFFAFAWFELIDPAPQDPARLATAVTAYLGVTLAGMLVFGQKAWLSHCEAFSIFFRLVSWLAPFGPRRERLGGREPESPNLSIMLPGLRLLGIEPLPPSGVAFVLLALASVSFDGLSRTFWWLDLIGVNPLEYPGRTVLMGENSLGILGMFAVLLAAYGGAVLLGRALARPKCSLGDDLGRYVVAIIPIAFGYHFAHYLPSFLVDVQHAGRALSDPFALGWDLLGMRDLHVTASLLAHHRSVAIIWNVQVAGIVLAHVLAVALAHLLARRNATSLRDAVLAQFPMTALMIAYTLFGLWLLSTPVAG